MEMRRSNPIVGQLLIPLVVYAVAVIPAAMSQRERINPDAVAYIRFAQYLAQGDFSHSVSGYWSPLISWCIAPLMAAGMDGLYAARTVLAVWGGLLVVAFYFFLGNFEGISKRWRFAATLLVALMSVHLAVVVIAPDLILATCLFAYLALIAGNKFAPSRWRALGAGAVAGVGFLAKAYALPFFLLHLSMTVVLGYVAGRKDEERRAGARYAGAWALAGFAAVAGPWIGVLSAAHGRLTISTAAARKHAVMHWDNPSKTAPLQFGLAAAPHISLKETPEAVAYPFWSPLEHVGHQMRVVGRNLAIVRDEMYTFDGLPFMPYLEDGGKNSRPHNENLRWRWMHLGLGAFLIAPVALALVGRGQRRKTAWVWLTGAIYGLGLSFVYLDAQQLTPVLLPLALVLALQLALTLARAPGAAAGAARHILALLVAVSFFAAAVKDVKAAWTPYTPTAPFRQIARHLQESGVSGSIASSDWPRGLYIAYFMDRPYVGFPEDKSDAECEQLLKETGVLLCWPEPNRADVNGETFQQAQRVASDSKWHLLEEKFMVGLKNLPPPPPPRRKSRSGSTKAAASKPAAVKAATAGPLLVYVRTPATTKPAGGVLEVPPTPPARGDDD